VEAKNVYRIFVGKSLETSKRGKLKGILEYHMQLNLREAHRGESGRKWLRIVSSGGLWYQRC
jgi:hypothetical protein